MVTNQIFGQQNIKTHHWNLLTGVWKSSDNIFVLAVGCFNDSKLTRGTLIGISWLLPTCFPWWQNMQIFSLKKFKVLCAKYKVTKAMMGYDLSHCQDSSKYIWANKLLLRHCHCSNAMKVIWYLQMLRSLKAMWSLPNWYVLVYVDGYLFYAIKLIRTFIYWDWNFRQVSNAANSKNLQ